MQQELEIKIGPEHLNDAEKQRFLAAQRLGISPSRITGMSLLRRSLDARGRQPVFLLRFRVWTDESPADPEIWDFPQTDVRHKPPVILVGLGPASMFAALRLIELGLKPVVLERGRDVRGRRRDLAALNKQGIVNPDSNYCFGEGGAGTFSDGKLYTRSHKRGDVRRTLEILVRHGASPDILVEAHPHIGTNKLPEVVQAIRETIVNLGGEVHFDCRVTEFLRKGEAVTGVRTAAGDTFEGCGVILATGHSARDIFYQLHRQQITVEAKPFALGVRAEHPQKLIDKIRLHCEVRPDYLPAASYAVVEQVLDRGVYSFCMCPGGIICPAATDADELVVNGWSPSKRNSPFANSGIVVEVRAEDLAPYAAQGPFAGLAFQQAVEQAAFRAGGGAQVAPAARLTDFVQGRISRDLPDCSYLPGITPADMRAVLPAAILERLQQGFRKFDSKLRGYLSPEAVAVATESRTSSPVRIPRDTQSLMHPQAPGLFPCGEGAGYAGGIVSAAMDGERCAEAAARYVGRD